MNILFLTVHPPERAGFSTNEKRPPLGVGYLMAVLKKNGHNVSLSDEYLKKTDILDSDYLTEKNIDIVAIYLNTICYQNGKKILAKLESKREKKEWEGKIFVGGPHTSLKNPDIPNYVDRIFIGESELTFPKVLSGEIKDRVVQSQIITDLDTLPMPAWEEFIYRPYDWTHPWLGGVYPIYTFNTSRGCPFSCTFCSVKSVWGKSYRYMSAQRIVNDIEYMIKVYGAKGIYFREDHFTLNKQRVVDFCNLLLKRNIKIDWMCETRADEVKDYDLQRLMKSAGCKVFYIGVESGSPRILEKVKKGETVDDFRVAFEIAKKVGIKTYASFVVGLPFENKSDIELTEKFIEEINPDYQCKNVYVGIPGSDLYDYIHSNKLYEYIDSTGVIYPNGYKKNIKKYYNNLYYEVYSSGVFDSTRICLKKNARKILNFKISSIFK